MFRGTPRMFESDALALEAAEEALQRYGPALLAPRTPPREKGAQSPVGWPLSWCEFWFLSLAWAH
eukprot:2745490-Alexandrium_andersonii.AAC.1